MHMVTQSYMYSILRIRFNVHTGFKSLDLAALGLQKNRLTHPVQSKFVVIFLNSS